MSVSSIPSNKEWLCHHPDELNKIAQELISFARSHQQSVWILEGDLGAGKTTFTKAICQVLGVKELVSSPTFSLINEYQTPNGESIYHCDFYRINNPAEVLELGLDDYLENGSYCFIEWASRIEPFLPESYLEVTLTSPESEPNSTSRIITVRSV